MNSPFYCLDTNVLVEILRGRNQAITERLLRTNPADLAVPSMVAAELFYGASKGKRPDSHFEVGKLLSRFLNLPFDQEAADRYGTIRAYLEAHGKLIGPNDLIIAATALAHRCTLVTNNVREFSRVPDLAVEDWS